MKKIEMGKKYRTRDGRAVRLLCVDRKHQTYPVVGLVGDPEILVAWTSNGLYSIQEERDCDLVEISIYADIPIDTPGWAHLLGFDWRRCHFAGVDEKGRPLTWLNGRTSFTAEGRRVFWDEFVITKPEGVE